MTGRPEPQRISQADIERARGMLTDVIGRDVRLVKHGVEFRGLCPFHDDHDPSLQIIPRKSMFYCPSCGAQGDAIDYVVERTKSSFRDAVEQILGRAPERSVTHDRVEPRAPAPDLYADWHPIIPVPPHARLILPGQESPPIANPKRWDDPKRRVKPWKPTMVHEYRQAGGDLHGYVLRQPITGEKGKKAGKVTPMVMWCHGPDGYEGWALRPFPELRPLDRLDLLAARPDAIVIVVEGEKSADAARQLVPKAVVLAWPGGTKAISRVDWTPLAGRKVMLWPDNDWQGLAAMVGLARRDGTIVPGAASLIPNAAVMVVDPADCPGGKGGDAADALAAGWTPEQTRAWLLKNARPAAQWEPIPEPERARPSEPSAAAGDQAPPHDDAPPPDEHAYAGMNGHPTGDHLSEHDHPAGMNGHANGHHHPAGDRADPIGFHDPDQPGAPVPLGVDRGIYWYLPAGVHQPRGLSAAQHTQSQLMGLASLETYWSRSGFVGNRGKILWDAAADWLMRACEQCGIYDPSRIRGRGAWLERVTDPDDPDCTQTDRVVIHTGDHLIVDGATVALKQHRSRYIYEAGPKLDFITDATPLANSEAVKLAHVCDMVSVEHSYMAQLLAGWIVIAPVCGALKWRPHLWVTSEAGGGKSWVIDNIIKPCVGPIALEVQSKTTEAGVRQSLNHDGRPIIFDEAEGQNERDRDRIQQILDLARQASSDGGAPIVKGSTTGEAKTYRIRSCFAFSSINLGVNQAADESRTIVVTIITDPEASSEQREEAFSRLRATVTETITPAFTAGLFARTVDLLPTIIANAEVFAAAIAEQTGSRRSGDTMGAAMAGLYSLYSRSLIDIEKARVFCRERMWIRKATEEVKVEPEGPRALQSLMQRILPISTANARHDRTVAELIAISASRRGDDHVSPQNASEHLIRSGIRLDGNSVLLGQSSEWIKSKFRRTDWEKSWAPTIARIPGGQRRGATRFGPLVSRAVSVPLNACIVTETEIYPRSDTYT